MSLIRLLGKFNRKEWIAILIVVALVAFGVWVDLTIPDFLRDITLIVQGQMPGEMSDVWRLGLSMLGLTLVSAGLSVIVAYISAVISGAHAERIRKQIFEKVNDFSSEEINKFGVPSLITRSTNDVFQIRMFVSMAIQLAIRSPIMVIWAVVRIVEVNLALTMVLILAVLALLVVISILIIFVMPRYRRIQVLTDDLNKVTRENLTGLRVVRAYNAKEHEQAKFEGANERLTRNNLVVHMSMGFLWPFVALLISALSLAVYWVGSFLIYDGQIANPGFFFADMMVFTQYALLVLMSFMLMIMVFVFLPRTVVSSKRIQEVLTTHVSVQSGGVSSQENSGAMHVSFKDVSFHYPGADANVLSDINLEIKRGSTVAFIGGTGCGKSTLVDLIVRLYDASEGEITVDGLCVKDYTLEALRDKIGYIPQTAVIYKGTVKSNVAFGEIKGEAVSDDQVERALKIAMAKEFVDKLPEGVDSQVSQSGKNLSGGQKQRLAIARVIARNPEMYIFDDTFSALDFKTDRALRNNLKKETKGATVLIVAQRIGTIKDADNIFVLDKGRIVSRGTHTELMKKCELYKEIALSQLSKEEL